MAEARLAAAGGDSATRHKPEFLRKEVAKAAEVNIQEGYFMLLDVISMHSRHISDC
jgi:hypothetical protein